MGYCFGDYFICFMKIKYVHPVSFLVYRVETTVEQLHTFLPVGQRLFGEAVARKHFIAGPVHWHYIGFTDVFKPFVLEVALPVGEVFQGYDDGEFRYKRTEAFQCVSCLHEGSWQQIPDTYGKIMQFMGEQNLSPVGENREVYINVDMAFGDGNTTEIQMGIYPR